MELPPDQIPRIGYDTARYIHDGDWEAEQEFPMDLDEAASPPPKRKRTTSVPTGKFMTASEMLGNPPAASTAATPRTAVEQFAQGMLVQHPEYGIGTIVALSGQGIKRSAVVRFFKGGNPERKFMLAYCQLTPVQSETR